MKIMHIICSDTLNGPDAVVLNLGIGLNRKGVKTIICCFVDAETDAPELGRLAQQKGIEVVHIRFRTTFDISVIRRLWNVINDKDVTLLHSHGYKPSFYCTLMRLVYGMPFIITCHNWTREKFKLRVYAFIEHITMFCARRIVAVSNQVAYKDIGSWKPLLRKTVVIHNGVDLCAYSSSTHTSAQGGHTGITSPGDSHKKIVGTLGRLAPLKNHVLLIESFAAVLRRHVPAKLVIAGAGPLRQRLEAFAEHMGIQEEVVFLGHREDAIAVLRSFDIFALSSDNEGLPMALLEAMSLGVPVVSTRVGQIPEVVSDGVEGLLVNPGDVGMYTCALVKLLENDAIAASLGIAAQKKAATAFSLETMVDAYCRVYSIANTR